MKATTLISGLLTIGLGAMAQTPLENAARLIENERFEQATSALRSVLATEPDNGEAWFLLGEAYFHNDRLDSAEIAYDHGTRVNPLMPLNAVGTGKVLHAKGRTAEAKIAFEAVIAKVTDKFGKTPKPMQAQVYREAAEGLVHGPEKDPGTALTYIDKAIALAPNDPEGYILKGDIQLEANPTDATAPLVNYRKAMELSPSSARPVARRALMYHRAANSVAAIVEYDKAVALDPSFAPAYRGRAESYFRDGKYEKAVADYDKYLELNQGNRSARVRYAQFLFMAGKYGESLALIQELEGEEVRNKTLSRLKGYNLVELKDTVHAVPALEAYFAVQPPDQFLSSDLQYYGRAIALLGNDSLAGEKLLAAAAMPNANPDLYSEAASFFMKARLFDKAVEAYQGKVRSGKVAVNDWYYLGIAANRAKQYDVADEAWAHYIEKQPNIHQGYLGRARANVGLDPDKKTWQAKPYYEEVVRRMKPEEAARSPMDAEEAFFYLAFYHFTVTKDPGAAKCWFEKVKDVNAGTGNTKVANDMLLTKELKDVRPTPCEVP